MSPTRSGIGAAAVQQPVGRAAKKATRSLGAVLHAEGMAARPVRDKRKAARSAGDEYELQHADGGASDASSGPDSQ